MADEQGVVDPVPSTPVPVTTPPAPEPAQTLATRAAANGLVLMFAAAAATGLICAARHLAGGDFELSHYGECLTLMVSGAAGASPGLNGLKAGLLSRR